MQVQVTAEQVEDLSVGNLMMELVIAGAEEPKEPGEWVATIEKTTRMVPKAPRFKEPMVTDLLTKQVDLAEEVGAALRSPVIMVALAAGVDTSAEAEELVGGDMRAVGDLASFLLEVLPKREVGHAPEIPWIRCVGERDPQAMGTEATEGS